jgi:N-acetylglucosaminyldiphosphoundecaprenol N-acetyl-beta-D-mannosaminyltransferase
MTATATPVVRMCSTEIAPLTLSESVDAVMDLTATATPQLVVTPNVDHLVMLEHDREFARAYGRAALRLADGAPVVALSRLLGTRVPERVTGIDLSLATLVAAERQQRSVFLFGGAPNVLDAAVCRLRAGLPDLHLVGALAPRVELDSVTADEERALTTLRGARPDLVLLFLGTPKQEKWFWRRVERLPPTVALAVGGAVDFIAGARHRAPAWVQHLGGEWLWRMAQEPRRLGHRYLVQDRRFAVIAAREVCARRRSRVVA